MHHDCPARSDCLSDLWPFAQGQLTLALAPHSGATRMISARIPAAHRVALAKSPLPVR